MKRFFMAMMAALLCCLCAASLAEERVIEPSSITVNAETMSGTVELHATCINGEEWLFLPAFADAAELTVAVDGTLVSYELEEGEEHVWHAALSDGTEMNIMRSENLRAVFLFSSDPVHQGREYIEAARGHSVETTGRIALVDALGEVDYAGRLRQLRGRGNTTWGANKKPYQFKLEDRADLLQTGDPREMNRTWVLLADVYDPSLLRNRISLDLALELGLSESSRCEHVNLYYDGEYCGVYLLAEKVELGEGRIEETDYQELIDSWCENTGLGLPDFLPASQALNAYGNEIHFIEGIPQTADPATGAFLLEMEGVGTLTDRSWFTLSDGSIVGCKNPDNASEGLVRYISEKLESARRTLQNGGVNPDNGHTIEDDFDITAFARAALLYELSYSVSGYQYSSSFFVLPAGEDRFKPGGVWDFDLTWRYFRTGVNDRGVGFKTQTGWLPDFYSVPSFMEEMKRVYREELAPAVENILLGDQQGRFLKPLDQYVQEIQAAQRMDRMIWGHQEYIRGKYSSTFAGEIELLRRFVEERHQWMYDAIVTYGAPEYVGLTMFAYYGHTDLPLTLTVFPWQDARVISCEHEQLTEATEEDYAVWQAEVVLETAQKNPVFVINGVPLSSEKQEDGSWRVAFTFEDPSYRPVDYYGDDLGLIYDFEAYCRNYPDVAEMCEYDPETTLEYFCDEGMYLGHMGNEFFQPFWVRIGTPDLNDTLGEDWSMYYWEFLYYGKDENWLLNTGNGYQPVVEDALEM